MTLNELLRYVDAVLPNQFDDQTKTQWINRVERSFQIKVLRIRPRGVIEYDISADGGKEPLLCKLTGGRIYVSYVFAMIYMVNSDAAAYEKAYKVFESEWLGVSKWYISCYNKKTRTWISDHFTSDMIPVIGNALFGGQMKVNYVGRGVWVVSDGSTEVARLSQNSTTQSGYRVSYESHPQAHISVTRGNTVITGSDYVYDGQLIYITVTFDEGYESDGITVNGAPFENGGSITISGSDIFIYARAKEKERDPGQLESPLVEYAETDSVSITGRDERADSYLIYDNGILVGTYYLSTGTFEPEIAEGSRLLQPLLQYSGSSYLSVSTDDAHTDGYIIYDNGVLIGSVDNHSGQYQPAQ